MMLARLLAKYLKQVEASGSILVQGEEAPDVSSLASLFAGSPTVDLLIRHAEVRHKKDPRRVYPLAPRTLSRKPGNKQEFLQSLARELHKSGHQVKLGHVGRKVVVKIDEEFYPLLELLQVAGYFAKRGRATLRTATTKGQHTISVNFFAKEPLAILVLGELATGESVQAYFDHSVIRISIVPNVGSKVLLLSRVCHPELDSLDFDFPLFLLTTRRWLGTSNTSPVRPGHSFLTRFRFGANLRQAVTSPGPLSLNGDWRGSPGGLVFRLESSPFAFTFGPVQIRAATLIVDGQWDDDTQSKEYVAWMRGVWNAGTLAIPLWTELPEDDGVMCWNTPGAETWLDEPAPGAENHYTGFDLPLTQPSDASPLLADWDGWFNQWGDLVTLLRRAAPLRLVHFQLGVDAVTRQPSDVAMTILGSGLTITSVPALQTARIYFNWSVGNPWDASARSVMVEAHVDFTLGGMEFEGCMTPPQFRLRARSKYLVGLQTACQGLQLNPQTTQDPEVYVDLNLGVFGGGATVTVETEDGQSLQLL